MKQTQLLKGVLDGCVLAIISDHEIYGYELIQALREDGFDSIVGGTLYPLLAKLENRGDLIGQFKTSPDGPQRKYYAITPQGLQTLVDCKFNPNFWTNWSA
ncbi:PadR family transcriptional regulator [Lactiplantibacillus plantarum]|uniref:PadR family transcriptional regulator n=1 Tax=Lactiplantibacillus plantarum TaxID=1590 RepID=UPI003965AC7E